MADGVGIGIGTLAGAAEASLYTPASNRIGRNIAE
jgi:hypothetical protein